MTFFLVFQLYHFSKKFILDIVSVAERTIVYFSINKVLSVKMGMIIHKLLFFLFQEFSVDLVAYPFDYFV